MAERVAFFGLRSNVGYFRSSSGFAKLDTRLKAAALLYDHVLLEAGVYECTITDGGSMAFVMPLSSDEQLKPLRTRRGVVAGLRMAATGSTDFRTMVAGRTEAHFRSQFYAPMRELEPLKPDWVEHISLTTEAERVAKDVAGRWDRDDRNLARELMADQSEWFQSRVVQDLNHDLAQAGVLGAELLPHGSNSPLLRAKARRGVNTVGTGERPLRVLVPDIRGATWADIAEVRKLRGMDNVRARLRELDDANLADDAVRQRLETEMLQEFEKMRPRRKGLITTLVMLGAGLLPVTGAIAEGVSIGKNVADVRRVEAHWMATLVRAQALLQSRASERRAN